MEKMDCVKKLNIPNTNKEINKNMEFNPIDIVDDVLNTRLGLEIQNYDNAINQYGGGPNFNDLQLTWTFNVDNGATYNKKAYNKKIHNEGSFIVSEYEVFGITRKRQ
ncbi:9492_t:CDS:2 [Rhizophagus irregularis]|nr:9492_t:CDS:2 [Rhizophagus irregularis]